MKLALIGGGGVRSPEFVRGALAFAADIGLQELWLMDIEPSRLNVMVPLCQQIVEQANSPFTLHHTTNLEEALRDADMIVTTIRVGAERGRVLDERIALKHNVLGQETTGPGGFSMAMRSIPALLDVAEQTERLTPRAWTFNFTNPAGLVSQALHDAGFQRIVGICDSANTAQYEIAHWLDVPTDMVKTEVFGLNHLSWTRSARIKGKNVLPALLQDDDFVQATHLRFFGPQLARNMGMFLNEYLYYYYFRDVAVQRIKEEELTRGEEVEVLNNQLFETLHQSSPDDYLRVYDAYNKRRSASYMAYAETDETLRRERANPTETTALLHQSQDDVGGYAGVALRTALAISQDLPLRIGLNVPNEGAIPTMRDDDVVEVTCEVDGNGIKPVKIGDIPEHADLLMHSVKYYERLAVRAILDRDRELAVEAMASHPLVGSYALGRTLVNEYLDAHQEYTGEWHHATSL
ncbi:MAG: 6-phospho-beta-glucosidase [Chloroflexi bacterium]|nr:6-phospho-beta-glucosidase [Chloroflexota bacterium]